VDEELRRARSMGVSGVPFFAFKSGGVSGAQVKKCRHSSVILSMNVLVA
jgi:predicted DsbA family dithiol-disulfide isomerase